ncbi:DUF2461 domain-containing protein [Rapidithrix thailandica]|uniref:DUF2461 domain-containing protein n=1 Tax=Rapidithrix thailandica TaxID=413964 RepID=A0AAW9SHC9_9BACT
MDLRQTLDFLTKLSENNNREWMMENKPEYEKARQTFKSLVESVISGVSKLDDTLGVLEAKQCIFRINRDIRFSKDKRPYKENFGAFICPGGRKSGMAGYYVHLQPGESFLAGGVYMPGGQQLAKIRQEIDYNTEDFLKLIQDQKFVEYFTEIKGEKLKTAPKGYPKDHPHIDLLRFKSYLMMHPIQDKTVLENGFEQYLLQVFEAMKPFNHFLNTAIND